jgi:hypothetical protein
MPTYLRTDHADLRLILTSAGQVVDTQAAATPEQANRIAIMMLASRDVFDVDDTLTCGRVGEGGWQ